MASTWKYVDKYLVQHYGRKSGDDRDDPLASIVCYNKSDIIGYINFYLDGHVPASELETSSTGSTMKLVKKTIMISFPIDRIGEILETLRQEEPINIGINPSQKVGWVGTSVEPVGEEEGV